MTNTSSRKTSDQASTSSARTSTRIGQRKRSAPEASSTNDHVPSNKSLKRDPSQQRSTTTSRTSRLKRKLVRQRQQPPPPKTTTTPTEALEEASNDTEENKTSKNTKDNDTSGEKKGHEHDGDTNDHRMVVRNSRGRRKSSTTKKGDSTMTTTNDEDKDHVAANDMVSSTATCTVVPSDTSSSGQRVVKRNQQDDKENEKEVEVENQENNKNAKSRSAVVVWCRTCQTRRVPKACHETCRQCVECCKDATCTWHVAQRAKQEWKQKVLTGTTPIQLHAKHLRASRILRRATSQRATNSASSTTAIPRIGTLSFHEPGFVYTGDTVVIWNLYEYHATPKWRDDAIRKSQRRKQQLSQESLQQQATKPSRTLHQWVEDSYQDYLQKQQQRQAPSSSVPWKWPSLSVSTNT